MKERKKEKVGARGENKINVNIEDSNFFKN